eukprot:CAMPEP_0194147028 /NCGR_PEP_ID=MMETSP0152-20130528/22475_1 /TAXON_ID=1049557 /ORGANISM="Thalassiothrix antarctica, Strain L6-D1" /LENGTH=327 /DNA_ID=CAMNT_0038847699 /DNA_START=69 /DNA_END=1052 /DNA_ORIENTATION=+
MRYYFAVSLLLLLQQQDQYLTNAFTPSSHQKVCLNNNNNNEASLCGRRTTAISSLSPVNNEREDLNNNKNNVFCDRRDVLRWSSAATVAAVSSSGLLSPLTANAVSTSKDGNLPDLPPEAVRSYLQYRISLQISADYYLWELQELMENPSDWGDVGQLFRVNNNKGQGQPSRIERDYVNPMRILSLSMLPDTADALRDSQFKFERAMGKITKATAGIQRDLPVEIDPKAVPDAKKGWEEGRVALNSYFTTLNEVTGLNELRAIPPPGPNQTQTYGRSKRKYFDLAKKTKLCQNRGGPILSNTWGQLMVTGYLQDSCGIPDMDGYFYQ